MMSEASQEAGRLNRNGGITSKKKKSWECFSMKEVTGKVREEMTVSGFGGSLYARKKRAKTGV